MINTNICTSSHIHPIGINNFQQVYDSSITNIHQTHNNTKHVIYTKFTPSTLNMYASYQLQCNAPRHDTYMHVVPNHLRGRHPMMQQTLHNHPNNWIQRIHQHVMMHEHMTQSTTMHIFTQLQQSSPTSFITCLHQQFNIIACMKIHQQHICT